MEIRKARFTDIEAIHAIVNGYAEEGQMLARARNVLYETLRDMTVAEEDGRIVGVGALHLTWDELAEVRTLAVDKAYSRRHIGTRIVERLLEEAKEIGVKTVFTLTYRADFFSTLGFVETSKESLHHKVWKDCINCPKFPNCDETAMTLSVE
ncbi:MAG: N-acetyltransferase [Selenomonadales bacterium]|nr:N-acetyltransferase [Selenomonadales bacterium]MBQ6712792.1 N-acetyltransferase [Selenomonadales bacterium]